MSETRTHPPKASAGTHPTRRIVVRWMGSFAGYPLGGYLALLLTGRVDAAGPALAGGLVAGAVLGAGQAWAMGRLRPHPVTWTLATAVGLMAGLAAGASLVDYRTDLASLLVQGAVTGAILGLVQALVLVRRLGPLLLVWPVVLSGTFALGWSVTTAAGIDVDQQFVVFGASGALVVTAFTSTLPVVLASRARLTMAHRRPRV